MTQKTIKIFKNEIYSKPPKTTHSTNKLDVYQNDDIWSLDILDLKDLGAENSKGYRYVWVVIDDFSKFAWTVPLEKKSSKNKRLFEKILITSKRTNFM